MIALEMYQVFYEDVAQCGGVVFISDNMKVIIKLHAM